MEQCHAQGKLRGRRFLHAARPTKKHTPYPRCGCETRRAPRSGYRARRTVTRVHRSTRQTARQTSRGQGGQASAHGCSLSIAHRVSSARGGRLPAGRGCAVVRRQAIRHGQAEQAADCRAAQGAVPPMRHPARARQTGASGQAAAHEPPRHDPATAVAVRGRGGAQPRRGGVPSWGGHRRHRPRRRAVDAGRHGRAARAGAHPRPHGGRTLDESEARAHL
ncbi:hypothetical protein T484DRAFT_2221079 [Baffinella frigidus]|nr:hypothetical protein T484DRAFT_2221079 [Cryptophyta sp. CCMP2293]